MGWGATVAIAGVGAFVATRVIEDDLSHVLKVAGVVAVGYFLLSYAKVV
jgi:hypothetical protein